MTARTLYSCTMSLDGFIAGPSGDMHWLLPFFGPDPVADILLERTGSLLIGRRTFGGDDPNSGTENEGAFGGAFHGPSFVLTHRPPDDPPADPALVFVTDVESGVAQARAAAGDKYVNILGAGAARSCLEAGLLDEIMVFVAPVLLGDGTRLFEWTGGRQVDLRPRLVSQGPKAVALWYELGY
jgi:dihydrofolate reductase